MRYYFTISFLLILVKINNSTVLDDLTSTIENAFKKAANYKPRRDNSDIYSEAMEKNISDYGQFDFIVVGAGTAGSIVAKRLSEFKFKTLLLEAGDVQNNLTDIPGLFTLFQNTNLNWGYTTTKQKNSCLGMIDQQCGCPRGKTVGGTGAINGMTYARGNSHDQDFWADFGISGWSWRETLPYFKKFENYENIYGDPGYHGWNGSMYIDYNRPDSILVENFLRANQEVYQITEDYNGKIQIGAGKIQMQKHRGKRSSTSRVYLTEYNKDYLKIETNAYVYKIILTSGKVEGVLFVKNHKHYRATVTKEVIISAGTINSPQILMLSGIGPKEELSKHKIPLEANLPVGRNYDDHVGFFGVTFESNLTLTDRNKSLRNHVWDYLSEVGTLTNNGMPAIAFLSTEKNKTYPDLEILLTPIGRALVPNYNQLNLNEESAKALSQNSDKIDNVFSANVILLHSKSKGTITLRSKNPNDFPVINTNGFSNPEDIEKVYEGVLYLKSLMKTKAFKEIDAKIIKLILPGCKKFEYDSKEYWLCMIRHLSTNLQHNVGTCLMGRYGTSVVDNNLRVHGVKGLRVADLSVAPKTNSGHTNALAMMIGEKAADIIKSDH